MRDPQVCDTPQPEVRRSLRVVTAGSSLGDAIETKPVRPDRVTLLFAENFAEALVRVKS